MRFVGWASSLTGALLLLLLGVVGERLAAQDLSFDVLILDGRVLDGTGNPWIRQDIGIRGDRIVAMGRLKGARARRTIDARGLYVAPGFIDLHSHADRALVSDSLAARRAFSLVSQGLTTVVGAADGRNARWPLAEEVAAYEKLGIPMNVVLMVGHSSVRRAVMGDDYEREATSEEVARMKELVRQAMEEGAWGLAAGLEYRPARFSQPVEVIELAQVVAGYDGFYVAHQRSEALLPLWQLPSQVSGRPVDGLQALEETIEIARRTGIRVVASHQKARGRSAFGRAAHDTIVVNRARAEGLQVYLDVYPYETFGGSARILLPNWALVAPDVDVSGGNDSPVFGRKGVFDGWRDHLRRNWSDPGARGKLEQDIAWLVEHDGGPDRVLVVDHADEGVVGKTLAELAATGGKSVPEVVVELALTGHDTLPGGALLRGNGIHDVDVEAYFRQPYTATSSDATVSGVKGVPGFEGGPGSHPRHFGAFVRRIARYVKDTKTTSLEFAIRSMTGLPAQIIGLRDRGFLREGYKADLVVFDLGRLRDRATVLEPERYSEGIEYVMVNGTLTVDGGRLTGALPGVVIRKRAVARGR